MSFSEKKMLIVIGPQGSGNHMWAKIFGLHKSVYGWQKLQEQYWEAHHYEPFARAWDDPTTLTFPKGYDNFATSCSIPYVYKGGHRVAPILGFFSSTPANASESNMKIEDFHALQNQTFPTSTTDIMVDANEGFRTPTRTNIQGRDLETVQAERDELKERVQKLASRQPQWPKGYHPRRHNSHAKKHGNWSEKRHGKPE